MNVAIDMRRSARREDQMAQTKTDNCIGCAGFSDHVNEQCRCHSIVKETLLACN
jgi:hypothetical protein